MEEEVEGQWGVVWTPCINGIDEAKAQEDVAEIRRERMDFRKEQAIRVIQIFRLNFLDPIIHYGDGMAGSGDGYIFVQMIFEASYKSEIIPLSVLSVFLVQQIGPLGNVVTLKVKIVPANFTGGRVEGEQGAAIHVVLIDAYNGHVVTSGPESSARLDIVVLEGDFNNEDEEDWTDEDFESHVVKEREGKRPLLTGDLQVSLKEGVGTVGELTFTDNSSWIRSRKFRLGLKVAPGYCDGIRIREGKTEAFTVKDHRGELYKKHYPPALKDEIPGSGMSNKMWEVLVEHAKTCVLSGKYYVYYSDESRNVGAIFNNIYEFTGLIAGGQYYSAESLNDSQKVFADALVKKAYDNWMHVIEYDGKALLSFKQKKKSARSESSSVPQNNISFNQQASQQQLPAPPLLRILQLMKLLLLEG
ncbi:hypothetical protein HPP92_014821 [Vanilla planifolia]|uniref:Uncharacterized protein n=1 Tax=Vanilla planifolia TaxID=51239 RepID=A0A835UWL6_VANPL|nr:hypothetical protein HPP92_014821 [Vanilla planifolia]